MSNVGVGFLYQKEAKYFLFPAQSHSFAPQFVAEAAATAAWGREAEQNRLVSQI